MILTIFREVLMMPEGVVGDGDDLDWGGDCQVPTAQNPDCCSREQNKIKFPYL